jgi:drug/metabolite transporter (DMT)-like permease
MMRISRVAGIALIAAGAVVLVWGDNFTFRRDVQEVGGLTVTTEGPPLIAPWSVVAALIAGVGLIVIDARRKA